MSTATYDEVVEGDVMTIPDQGLDVACCACGEVHELSVVGGGSVRVRVRRMPRSTGQVRRWMRLKREGIFGRNRKARDR
jgi:uncharacterized Zn finger protein